ncbi:MAG: TetR/AcrR family transcriptional regulator [Elusimicrobiota bacterium]|jgi:TetR/AcrR family fatty acid metabolism transcriptional regulator
MSRPCAEPPETRRRRILDAARMVLVKEDLEDLRVDDVAKKARIAKGTLYLYFRDKQALMSAVFSDLSAQLESRLQKASGAPPLDALRIIAQEHLSFMDENPDLATLLVRRDPFLRKERSAAPLRERTGAHLSILVRSIREAVAAGLLRPHDPQLGALHFLSLVRLFKVRQLLQNSGKTPLRSQVQELLDLFLKGLGSPEAAS